jgi:hypothetical protein
MKRYLGDHVETVVNKFGGSVLARQYTKLTGKPCNCAKRKAALNAMHKRLTRR